MAQRRQVPVAPTGSAVPRGAGVLLQTALNCRYALDQREWLPDESLAWTTPQQVIAAHHDMVRHMGIGRKSIRFGGSRSRPCGRAPKAWKPHSAAQSRH